MTLKDFIRLVPYFQDVRVKCMVTYLDDFEHEIERSANITMTAGSADIVLHKEFMMADVGTVVAMGDTIVVSTEAVDMTKVVR